MANTIETLTRSSITTLLNNQPIDIDINQFIINAVLNILVVIVLAKIYVKYGQSPTNRKSLANNFLVLSLTTMMIISVIKSSLALSLGLVGALSIVRFRAAIKDPEELVYIFLVISMGLGFGANQVYITMLSFIIISLMLIVKGVVVKSGDGKNLYLKIEYSGKKTLDISDITSILKKYCSLVDLKRYDLSDNSTEILLLVNLKNKSSISSIKDSLNLFEGKINISFLDQ